MTMSNLSTNKLQPVSSLKNVGTWAVVSNAKTGTYTDSDGTWDYWQFTSSGTLTVATAGVLDILMLGGGGGYSANVAADGLTTADGGRAIWGIHKFTAAAHTVTIGTGGITNGVITGCNGGATVLGSLNTGASWLGAVPAGGSAAITSSITGTSLVYGRTGSASPRTNSGDGGSNGVSGASGVVIVRRLAA